MMTTVTGAAIPHVCGLVGVRRAWTEHKQKSKQVLECEVRQTVKVCYTESERCQKRGFFGDWAKQTRHTGDHPSM